LTPTSATTSTPTETLTSTPTETPTQAAQVLGQGATVAVHKSLCDSIGPNNTCSGTDQSLDGYSINFEFHRGLDPTSQVIDVLSVTLVQGGGSNGKDVSGELMGVFYTVCEVPVAYPPGTGGTPVNLNGAASPNGSNQVQTPGYPLCITVQLTRVVQLNQSQLQFVNTVAGPTSTPTPTVWRSGVLLVGRPTTIRLNRPGTVSRAVTRSAAAVLGPRYIRQWRSIPS
jgi:hypothetical protein